jgi:hypothetical protein
MSGVDDVVAAVALDAALWALGVAGVVSAGDFEESEGGVVADAAAPVAGAATLLGAGV